MSSLPPSTIVLVILLALTALGSVGYLVRRIMIFRSYQDIADDLRRIARALRGQVFRDGGDLVVSGNRGPWPVVVRFSHAETMPGLDIRMEAPASFTLWVAPRSANATEGRAVLRTSDPRFDARLTVRSDHPTQANLLLAARQMPAALHHLCASKRASLAVGSGRIELVDEVIPHPNTARHVLDRIAAMTKVAEFLQTIPGAEKYKIQRIRKEQHFWGRTAIAAGAVGAILTVGAATQVPADHLPLVAQAKLPAGISPLEAASIPGVGDCRLVGGEDFDPVAAAWLRANDIDPSPKIALDLTGKGAPKDAAYLLVNKRGMRRVVLVAGGENRYDIKYPFIGVVARVPKSEVNSIQWVGNAPSDINGDGLLITREPNNPTAGLVLFVSGKRIISAVPANYQAIRVSAGQ